MAEKISTLVNETRKAVYPMMSNREIVRVSRAAWPSARASIAGHYGRIRMSERKRTVEETIWALARLGRLRTEAEARVIEAACTWMEMWDFRPDGDEDQELYDAIVALPRGAA